MDNITDQLDEIYTILCRSALNAEYYGRRLSKVQTINTWYDVIVAVGTTGSGISGLSSIRTDPYGKYLWGVLVILSSLLALAKPIIHLNKQVERLTKLFVGHTDNYNALMMIASRIKRQGKITDETRKSFEAAEKRLVELSREDDPRLNQKLLLACDRIVRQRHPPEAAWYPLDSARRN